MMHKPKIAIIIPTYNELETSPYLVLAIHRLLPYAEIIVVDDQSPDGTAALLRQLSHKLHNLTVIDGAHKQGRGAAVWQGMQTALKNFPKTEVFVEMDADFSHRPSELARLITTVSPLTAVVASRYLPDSKIYNWPLQRRIFSRLANFAIVLATKLPLHDNTNGFRAYPRSAVQIVLAHRLTARSYLSLTEVALILRNHNFHFAELPSIFPNRTKGVSNTNWQEIRNNLSELHTLFQKYNQGCTCV